MYTTIIVYELEHRKGIVILTRSEKRDLNVPAKILQKGKNSQQDNWSFRYSLLSLTSHKHDGSDFMKRERGFEHISNR